MSAPPTALAYPPRVTGFTRPFYAALAEGRLTTTRCRDCDRMTFPPKFACPHCWSRRITWASLAGTGTLRTFTEVWAAPTPFAGEVPYVLGIIDLDEGLRCLARIEGSYDDHAPDERVEMVIWHTEPVPLFAFRRAGGERAGGEEAGPRRCAGERLPAPARRRFRPRFPRRARRGSRAPA